MKATQKNGPVHLIADASPKLMPATSRHGRGPSVGMPVLRSAPSAMRLASRARIWSRSRTSAPKAAATKNSRNTSSSAVRASTSDRPSSAISSPAIAPNRLERNIRRAVRATTRTVRQPKIAGTKRQPKELSPNSHVPNAISHFPSGGWTMNM